VFSGLMQEAGDIKRALALSGPCERVSLHWDEYRVRECYLLFSSQGG
jgi:hypothetical protein